MLSTVVERHIALYRATGHLFQGQANLLRNFARYAVARGDKFVRAKTAVEWAALGPSIGTRHGRLDGVRRFARRAHAEDPRHEVPPAGLFGGRPPRRTPYIYSLSEIRSLLVAAEALGPRHSLRPRTYVTLLGLIASTGLRISEALALRVSDITGAGLIVRETKFRKNRLVPLHLTTRRALQTYIKARRAYSPKDDAVFLSEWRRGLSYPTFITTFLDLVREVGIHPGKGKSGPRIHDLRHTFAVRSLEQCVGRSGPAISRHILALSTYLGHAHVSDTYWYFQATPRILADIASQSEKLARQGAQ